MPQYPMQDAIDKAVTKSTQVVGKVVDKVMGLLPPKKVYAVPPDVQLQRFLNHNEQSLQAIIAQHGVDGLQKYVNAMMDLMEAKDVRNA